jgi:hypothetical protein
MPKPHKLANSSVLTSLHLKGRSYRVRLAQVAQILAQNHAPKIWRTGLKNPCAQKLAQRVIMTDVV